MQSFYSMAVTTTVRQCVERKCGDMYALMLMEIEMVKKFFEAMRRTPPSSAVMPSFGKRASTASGMLFRLQRLWATHQVMRHCTDAALAHVPVAAEQAASVLAHRIATPTISAFPHGMLPMR